MIVALIAILIVSLSNNSGKSGKNQRAAQPQSEDIPITIVDPLKGDPEAIDDLLALFAETQEEDLKGEDIDDVKIVQKDDAAAPDLNVTIGFWSEQKAKATAARTAPTGLDPPGTTVPPERFDFGRRQAAQANADSSAANVSPARETDSGRTRRRVSPKIRASAARHVFDALDGLSNRA